MIAALIVAAVLFVAFIWSLCIAAARSDRDMERALQERAP